MKKLGKKLQQVERSVEAYISYCYCGCACSCNNNFYVETNQSSSVTGSNDYHTYSM